MTSRTVGPMPSSAFLKQSLTVSWNRVDRERKLCHCTFRIQRFYMPLTGLMRKDLPLADGNVRKLIEDPSFPQWPTRETHIQHKVLYKNGVSKEYGVHGSNVAVDFDICIADGICITVCPVYVFDRMELPGEQEKMDEGVTNDSGKAPLANWKADPAREQDCIFCRACEIQCPVQAIKITEP